MTRAKDVAAARKEFDRKTAELVGHRITDVMYWDIHTFGYEPRTWDYNDWHHAVMGVELMTEAGPRTVIWTDTFFPYGVEVFDEPIQRHLILGPQGPEGWCVADNPLWRARAGQPVLAARTFWSHLDVGPGRRLSDGATVSPPERHDVPVCLRLDFEAGPVWFLAGMPQYPEMEQVFVPGDEIMVVFSSARMRTIGRFDGEFIGQGLIA